MKAPAHIRVLIVEDDFLVGEMIQGMLEDIGYTVAGKAFEGRQAIALTESLQPDVILMDIEMAGIDGLEAARQIRARRPTPVVVLTAYETPALIRAASEAGIGAYLVKPPRLSTLERAITIAMARFADMTDLHRLNTELHQRNQELEAALAKVKLLRGLLPICASCKKIRNDDGYWQQVEVYIKEHTEAEFSHGICPQCVEKLYPEYAKDILAEERDEIRD